MLFMYQVVGHCRNIHFFGGKKAFLFFVLIFFISCYISRCNVNVSTAQLFSAISCKL